ncbi:hypothetical protein JCM8208_000786, partial [Rhodotorula glutinis]
MFTSPYNTRSSLLHLAFTSSSASSLNPYRMASRSSLKPRQAALLKRKVRNHVKERRSADSKCVDAVAAAAEVEDPITLNSPGTDDSNTSTDSVQLESETAWSSSAEYDTSTVASSVDSTTEDDSPSANSAYHHAALGGIEGKVFFCTASVVSTYSRDDDRESALSLAGSAWTADSDDDVFYDSVEEQPLDDLARAVKVGNWVEGVLAVPSLIPCMSDAEYTEIQEREEARRLAWARADAAKAAKVVKVVEVVDEPVALEPVVA